MPHKIERLLNRPYKFDAGPIDTGKISLAANCQRTVQDFYRIILGFHIFSSYARSAECLASVGNFVNNYSNEGYGDEFWRNLKFGDIVFARSRIIINQPQYTEQQLLHMVVYLGSNQNSCVSKYTPPSILDTFYADKKLILHSTFREGKSIIWDSKQFEENYIPVAAKRFV